MWLSIYYYAAHIVVIHSQVIQLFLWRVANGIEISYVGA